MKIKLLIIAITLLAINSPSKIVQADPVTVITVQQATHDLRVTAMNLQKDLKQQQKRKQLKKIVKYLTTRVHKTGYVFSGSSIKGWDCSGMVRYAYKGLGITLEHSANKQAHIGIRVSKPRIGDIVVFAHQGSTNFYHSALYLGDDLIINANALYKTTVIQPLSDFKNSQIRFVRVIK